MLQFWRRVRDAGGARLGYQKGAKDRWEEALLEDPRTRRRVLHDVGVPIKPLYTPDDVEGDYEEKLGYPGEYPYTRGVYPNMYRGRLWTVRQFAGYGDPEETNKRFKYLLEHGQNGLSVAFDMPTLMGLDSDSPLSLGEVGTEGVAVDSLEDMERLFDGIPMGEISTSMTINAPAMVLLAMYVVAAEKQGVAPEELAGTNQNDILKEYIAQKEWLFPPHPSMRVFRDMLVYSQSTCRRWNTVSISGYHIREAGSPRRRSSPSPWPTASPTWRPASRRARRGRLRPALLVLLQLAHRLSSRRSASSAPRGASGPTC
jgi:methylmalonyl-CoA mutase N-terminal domain/subunit